MFESAELGHAVDEETYAREEPLREAQAHALDKPTAEQAERPFFGRSWRILPPKGMTGVKFTSWPTAKTPGAPR